METVNGFFGDLVVLVQKHHDWAAPVIFVLAFGESLALVSLLFPATVVLFGIGALIGAGGLDFWPLWLAAAIGAALGDSVSYWLGARYGQAIFAMWPLRRHPEMLPHGMRFFARWGVASVFLGRFFGPLRASVPLIAGICAMPRIPFQLANWGSALVWAAGILAPGAIGLGLLGR
ncbi:MAG: DedA family protein [Alphaproteobacteria bacterium]